MLPFLKRAKEASASAPVEKIEREHDDTYEEDEYDMLDSAMSELIDAVKSGDVKAASQAFRSAFEMCESIPHNEGEHTEEND